MPRPLASLVVVVYGAIYERYAAQLVADAERFFLSHEWRQIVQLPGVPGWPDASGERYRVILDNLHLIDGEHIFLIDADSRIEAPVGREILANGITVTTHPGYPDPGQADSPWEPNPDSWAYVAPEYREGRQYHPGAFVGGKRDDFITLAAAIRYGITRDREEGVQAEWYDEGHLNRYLVGNPPALVLPSDYCYWDFWGDKPPNGERRIITHLDKTERERELRGLEDQDEAA